MPKWGVRIVNLADIKKKLSDRLNRRVLPGLKSWVETDLVRALVYGGMGIQGIAQTDFYAWITSVEGLSELGIEASEPPKLLNAYLKTFKVTYSSTGRTINLDFGDIKLLKLMTPHPAAGTGSLNIDSWLTWVFDDITVNAGFVSRARISRVSPKTEEYIRLGPPLGGLMLPARAFGISTGHWKFPSQFSDYDIDWVDKNRAKIRLAIRQKTLELIKRGTR